jgi:UDP-N-acetylmuramate--alanine ligase
MGWSGGENRRAGSCPPRAHFVGIAARGMSGLAQLFAQRGMRVTGSDPALTPVVRCLRGMGVRVHAGHEATPRLSDARLLVYPPGTGPLNPQRLAASRLGIVQGSWHDWLGQTLSPGVGVLVAGAREASVASAMVAWTLTRAGLDPTVLLARPAAQLGGWARAGDGPHWVVDALGPVVDLGLLEPRVGLVMDLEGSRSEGPGSESRCTAVRDLLASLPRGTRVLVSGDDGGSDASVPGVPDGVDRLSLRDRDGWWGGDLREECGRFRFRAYHRGRFAVEVRLGVPGLRNVLCALGAVATCALLEMPAAEIKEGLEEFGGVSRDFESRGSYRGVTLVDDEGRSASAVGEALAVARRVFGSRPIWAVYETGGAAADVGEADGFVAAFHAADRVLIADERGEACPLVRALVGAGAMARGVASLDDVISELDRGLEPGDVLVTLGADEVGSIADAFIRRLPRDRQGR